MTHLLVLRCRFCSHRYEVVVRGGETIYACPECGTNTPDVLASTASEEA